MTTAPAVRWVTCAYCAQSFVSFARVLPALRRAASLDLRYAPLAAPAPAALPPATIDDRRFQVDPAQLDRYWKMSRAPVGALAIGSTTSSTSPCTAPNGAGPPCGIKEPL